MKKTLLALLIGLSLLIPNIAFSQQQLPPGYYYSLPPNYYNPPPNYYNSPGYYNYQVQPPNYYYYYGPASPPPSDIDIYRGCGNGYNNGYYYRGNGIRAYGISEGVGRVLFYIFRN